MTIIIGDSDLRKISVCVCIKLTLYSGLQFLEGGSGGNGAPSLIMSHLSVGTLGRLSLCVCVCVCVQKTDNWKLRIEHF